SAQRSPVWTQPEGIGAVRKPWEERMPGRIRLAVAKAATRDRSPDEPFWITLRAWQALAQQAAKLAWLRHAHAHAHATEHAFAEPRHISARQIPSSLIALREQNVIQLPQSSLYLR
ncbi:hypothetical protein, partial [Stenotrophomonas maltophilia]|uniref:hypothetical protein n=1 Tax=Stenotrophomonas maltophilia TaxID=40324 RepID=UPI0019D37D5D